MQLSAHFTLAQSYYMYMYPFMTWLYLLNSPLTEHIGDCCVDVTWSVPIRDFGQGADVHSVSDLAFIALNQRPPDDHPGGVVGPWD